MVVLLIVSLLFNVVLIGVFVFNFRRRSDDSDGSWFDDQNKRRPKARDPQKDMQPLSEMDGWKPLVTPSGHETGVYSLKDGEQWRPR